MFTAMLQFFGRTRWHTAPWMLTYWQMPIDRKNSSWQLPLGMSEDMFLCFQTWPLWMMPLGSYCWWFRNPAPVDAVDIPVFIGFIHPRWCRISSINSMWVMWAMFVEGRKFGKKNLTFLHKLLEFHLDYRITLNWLVVSTPLKNISQNGNLP